MGRPPWGNVASPGSEACLLRQRSVKASLATEDGCGQVVQRTHQRVGIESPGANLLRQPIEVTDPALDVARVTDHGAIDDHDGSTSSTCCPRLLPGAMLAVRRAVLR